MPEVRAATSASRMAASMRPVFERCRLATSQQQAIKQAAAQIRTVARPMSLNAYKVEVVQGLIERTVLEALGN